MVLEKVMIKYSDYTNIEFEFKMKVNSYVVAINNPECRMVLKEVLSDGTCLCAWTDPNSKTVMEKTYEISDLEERRP